MKCLQCSTEFTSDWRKGISKKNREKSPVRFCSSRCSHSYQQTQRMANPEYRKQIGQAISEKLKGKARSQTAETKKKLRDIALQRYAQGWSPKAGRCRKIQYESLIAGTVFLDGSWELAVAKYLDSIDVTWNRNTTRFPYSTQDGKRSTYCPDFYVQTWGTYIEVKGYETSLDRLKWNQFPHPLQVWKRQQLLEKGIQFLSSGKAK